MENEWTKTIHSLREEVAKLKAEVEAAHSAWSVDIDQWMKRLTKEEGENLALRSRAESLEEKLEKVREAIDGGEEDGLAAWVIIRELKQILGEK